MTGDSLYPNKIDPQPIGIGSKSVLLNAGSSGLDKEKGAGRMIFGRRLRAKIIREATFDAV
jgi:hypothetical protein